MVHEVSLFFLSPSASSLTKSMSLGAVSILNFDTCIFSPSFLSSILALSFYPFYVSLLFGSLLYNDGGLNEPILNYSLLSYILYYEIDCPRQYLYSKESSKLEKHRPLSGPMSCCPISGSTWRNCSCGFELFSECSLFGNPGNCSTANMCELITPSLRKSNSSRES